MANFGEQLKSKRKALQMSLDELAQAADVSKTYIANIENNKPHSVTGAKPKPSRPIVVKLAAALDWNVREAVLAAGCASEDDESEGPVINSYYDGLPPAEKNTADEIIKALWLKSQRDETTHGKKAE